MAKKNIDLAVVLHDDCDYKDWLVELKERFYSHRLKASCATNGYLLDFYWKLGRDIEAKQYTNTYGSGFYKNLSQDLKNEMPGVKGFSPTNLKYMSYFYKLYAPLQANCPQLADNFIEDLYIADIQRVVAQSKNRPQTADDFKLLFPVRRSDGFAIRRLKMSQPLYALGICNPQPSVLPCKSNPLLKKH